ncbi:MAG TPA: hypothetical protein VGR85_09030 [Candidatus Limnocylindria bacterium]|jgi:hypothetical protein|nr:hypothetical protein [Candidatus Limnocylindria bacterium]
MPSPQDLHIDALMTNFSIAYRNLAAVGDRLFPFVPVTKQSNKFDILDPTKDSFRVRDVRRAPRSRSNTVEWSNGTDTYFCESYAVNTGVDDDERANADDPISPDTRATQTALDTMIVAREDRIATKATTAASYSAANKQTLAGATQWSDATSDPRGVFDTAKSAIRIAVQRIANRSIMPFAVFQKVALVTKVLDAIKYTNLGVATVGLLQTYLGIDEIAIAQTIKNTANEGQTAVMADIWGKFCVIAYVEDGAGLGGMSFGKTFRWGEPTVYRWREDPKHTDFFEPNEKTDEKFVAIDAGYLVSAAIA